MSEEKKSVFETLYAIDTTKKVKTKNGLSYLSWASALAEVKKIYPNMKYEVLHQVDANGNGRPWFTDDNSGWVEVTVTIDGESQTEMLAIMDFKNKAIPKDNISSVDANKSIKRCLVKCLANFGLAMHIYEGEDMPEETARANELKSEIAELLKKKCVTDSGKTEAGNYCKAAEKEAFPTLDDDAISGNYKNIDDADILETLKKKLMKIRVK